MDRVINAIDLRLNAAIMTITNRLFPCGFDLAETPPETLADLKDRMRDLPYQVWSGASDLTIYGDAEVNYAFRAWHDFHYWRRGLDLEPHNEAVVADLQCADLIKVYGDSDTTRHWCEIIRADVIGQAAHYFTHGVFPRDQMEFVKAYLADKREALKRAF